MNPKSFNCPECGSNESREFFCVDGPFSEDDIWRGVLQCYKCAKCSRIIPAHLAEHWDGLTEEQACQEWRQLYRATAPTSFED